MKRILHNSFGKSILCLIVALLSGGTAWASEDIYKTVLFGQEYSSAQIGDFQSSWTSTYDGLTLNIVNFKNHGSSGWYNYLATGQNSTARTATATTATSIAIAITKVAVTFDALNDVSVTSVKLYTSTDGSSWTEAGEFAKAKGTQAVTLTPAENQPALYYRIEAVCKAGNVTGGPGKDNFLKISKIEFCYDDPYLTAAPVVTCSSANSPKFSGSTSVSISCPDATIQYSTDGGNQWHNYTTSFAIDETTTVKAKALGNGEGMRASHLVSTTFVNEDDVKDVTWDLSTNSYSESDADLVTWEVAYATMTLDKGTSSSNANKYLGGGRYTHTELYKNQVLTIAPTEDHMIVSVEITSTAGHVVGLNDRAWTNATASTSGNVVTVTPVDGTLPFSTGISTDGTVIVSVKVNYAPASSPFITAANAEIVSGTSGVIEVVYNRINISDITSSSVILCDAEGVETTYDWIRNVGFDADMNITYSSDANASASPRPTVAYMKVSVVAGGKTYVSPVFSVTQKAAFSVTISAAEYTTYVAPTIVSFPSDVTAYIVLEKTATTVKLTQKTSVPAGTPVILNGTQGTHFILEETTTSESVDGNLLLASDGNVSGGTNIYALSQIEGVVGFYPVNSSIKVPAGKAYLEITGGSVKGYTFFEDDATGIESLSNPDYNENIYNLAGQRISKMQQGINIINGKKVLK